MLDFSLGARERPIIVGFGGTWIIEVLLSTSEWKLNPGISETPEDCSFGPRKNLLNVNFEGNSNINVQLFDADCVWCSGSPLART